MPQEFHVLRCYFCQTFQVHFHYNYLMFLFPVNEISLIHFKYVLSVLKVLHMYVQIRLLESIKFASVSAGIAIFIFKANVKWLGVLGSLSRIVNW